MSEADRRPILVMQLVKRVAELAILVFVCLCLAAAIPTVAQPANDLCTDGIEIDCSTGAATVSGTTTGATFDDAGLCGTSSKAPGVWYMVVSPGGDKRTFASTCNQANFDTKISVYDGVCGTLGARPVWTTRPAAGRGAWSGR